MMRKYQHLIPGSDLYPLSLYAWSSKLRVGEVKCLSPKTSSSHTQHPALLGLLMSWWHNFLSVTGNGIHQLCLAVCKQVG